uniref:NAD-dependent epimerase/dehydratase domain-containing protein n=1 Tax=Pyrodinium bahamense TaxID=73915 RepID=A0A7S0FCN9_9DINO|eukprot:CAMPEP_0179075044 /NCGR_PEP_ID=MMETSP0796-20121207/33393_1 /TAXON_ID=73915 /ORGANISM="Pyrodinium bahamense, Strain pbaha01" /LENGTH=309 /DNA_ID=CAMNT_0020772275 /DNA_START=59 /DNA_END=988 /DNA_ORIENTATION=-
MPTFVVTGGAGFIGSHLVEALLARGDGTSVRVVDDLSTGKRDNVPDGVEFIVGDVADLDLMRAVMKGCDGVFHLAAVASVQRSNEDWLGTHRANLTATITVFEVARSASSAGGPIPVVYASSAAVFGANQQCPQSEDSAVIPLTAYGADKLACELHARVASHVHGVNSVGFRFFNVYGARQDPSSPYSGVIAIFASRLAAGKGITIFGDGKQTRDFVYVKDVVKFLTAAMLDKPPAGSEVYCICTGRTTTLLELAGTLGEVIGAKPEITHGDERKGDIRTSFGNPAKLQAKFGFGADTTLKEGLAQMGI